jgi:hypothetical protein
MDFSMAGPIAGQLKNMLNRPQYEPMIRVNMKEDSRHNLFFDVSVRADNPEQADAMIRKMLNVIKKYTKVKRVCRTR